MADFKLRVVTPERLAYEDEVTSIVVPGAAGYLGVLAHHAPLLSTLGQGTLTVRKGSEETNYQVHGGFLEFHGNQATVLVDELTEQA